MYVRLAVLSASLLVAACGGAKHETKTAANPVAERDLGRLAGGSTEASLLAATANTELRVRLNQDLGAGVSPAKDLFTARLTAPIVGKNGRVIAPIGSLVHGHVIHVDEGSRRVEIAFDRLETRGGLYRISATVLSAGPFAQTVAPGGTVDAHSTIVLQGAAPSAIGGGPPAPESEADEDAPRGDVIVPFDAELRLRLTAPLSRATATP